MEVGLWLPMRRESVEQRSAERCGSVDAVNAGAGDRFQAFD